MTQSRKRALVIFTAFALLTLIMYLGSVLDRKAKLERFTQPLSACKMPDHTSKIRQVGRSNGGIGQMMAALIISSDLTEPEVREYYQRNVIDSMQIDNTNIDCKILQKKDPDFTLPGSYDIDQEYGDSGQHSTVFVIVLSAEYESDSQ